MSLFWKIPSFYLSSKRSKNSIYSRREIHTQLYNLPLLDGIICRIYTHPPVFHPYFKSLSEGMRSDFEDFIPHVCLRDRENLITRSLRSRKGGSRARNLARLSALWMEPRHIKMIPVQFSAFHSSRTSRHSINMVFVRLNRAVKSSYYSRTL